MKSVNLAGFSLLPQRWYIRDQSRSGRRMRIPAIFLSGQGHDRQLQFHEQSVFP
jgi:hypothetical protein